MISYYFEDTDFIFRNKTLTNKWLKLVAESEIRRIGDISIIFCSDNYILDVNQKYLQNSKSSSLTGRLVYTEPLFEKLYLEASYQYSWSRSKNIKDAFDSGTNEFGDGYIIYNPIGEIANALYSNSILNENVNQRAGITFSWQTDKLTAQLGASANPTHTYNETNGKTYESNVVNWSPEARIRFYFNDYTNMQLNYNGRSAQPSTSQLMPVPDNTNPRNISLGNPYLQPYFNHNARWNFGYTNMSSFMSINGNISGGMVQNAITNAQWYDNAGVQYSIPVNGPGTGNVSGSLMLNTPLGNSNFSIMSNTSARYNESTSYIGSGTLDSGKYYDPAHPDEFNHDAFHTDFTGLIESGALVINIGTLDDKWIEGMIAAGLAASRRGTPVVLDPVGAGATSQRTEAALRIIEQCRPTIIRGNASEIMALVDAGIKSKGVDSSASSDDALESAKRLAAATGAVVVISGETDYITDGVEKQPNIKTS